MKTFKIQTHQEIHLKKKQFQAEPQILLKSQKQRGAEYQILHLHKVIYHAGFQMTRKMTTQIGEGGVSLKVYPVLLEFISRGIQDDRSRGYL